MRSMTARHYDGRDAYVFSAFRLQVVFNLPRAAAVVNGARP
jgi:hypothetical protein